MGHEWHGLMSNCGRRERLRGMLFSCSFSNSFSFSSSRFADRARKNENEYAADGSLFRAQGGDGGDLGGPPGRQKAGEEGGEAEDDDGQTEGDRIGGADIDQHAGEGLAGEERKPDAQHCFMMREKTSPWLAPSASRMPISRVRRSTA